MSTQPDPHQKLLVIEDRNFQDDSCIRYKKGEFLGKGGFARCYELINQETKQVEAVKIIQKSTLTKPRSKQKLMSEIKIHQGLSHRNIVQFRRYFQDHANVYIVLELCANKVHNILPQTLNDLFKRKRRLSENQIKYYLLQVLNALEYLHSRKIIHRDLKLGNLFLNENMEIKMGDFGLATKLQFPGEKKKTICGTPNYIAPQILESKGHSCQVDIWSFGVICYTLAFGRPPFESKDVKQTYKKIKAGIFSFPENINVSNQFKEVVMSSLQRQPHKRPTCSELKGFEFFLQVSLSRQPSLCFRPQSSTSTFRQEKQLSRSDNGKLYTNNELMISKDTMRQKSQDKFLVTERSGISILKNANYSNTNLRRANSQRVLKQSNSQISKSNLSKSPSRQLSGQSNNLADTFPFIAVKKWIDYSSKYGIGYALTNGSCGVYFNDSSKMVSINEGSFFYIDKIAKEDVYKKYSFTEYPQELKKKVSLFGHFKGYLYGQSQNMNTKGTINEKDLVYIRRWYRAKHAVIFRLNNKSVQVIFIDQSEILINSSKKKVVYTNKHKERSEYQLNQIMQSENRQLIKRFQYTKEVLNQMAGQHDKNKN